jgi:hypothetical protein
LASVVLELRTRPRTAFLIGFSSFSLLEARRRRDDQVIGPFHTAPPPNVPVFYRLGRTTQGLIVSARTLDDPARNVTAALVPAPNGRARIPLPTAEPPASLLADLTELFASLRWTYAKTYHDTAPHYWCKRAQFPDPATFLAVCRMIPTYGYRHRFPDTPGGSWWQAIDVPPRTVWSGWALPEHHGLINARPLVWAGRPAVPLEAHQELVVDGAVEVPVGELLARVPEGP